MTELDYGPVAIIKGKYKGQNGYYDDDSGKKAIVYLNGSPGTAGAFYVEIPYSSLAPIDSTIDLARLEKEHPEFVKAAGIVTKR